MKHKISLLVIALFTVTHAFAQNKDIDAQYAYTQAENAYAKNSFEECINYCEKAASTLGETNPKILSLQFNAYEAILLKCPYSDMIDRAKINGYLTYFFSHIDPNTYPREKYFDARKFKDDFENREKIYKSITDNIKKYTMEDLGLVFVKDRYNGRWIKLDVANGPIKEQTAMKDGFWVEGGERYNNDAIKTLNANLQAYQQLALVKCQDFFTFEIRGYYTLADSRTFATYEFKLPTRLAK